MLSNFILNRCALTFRTASLLIRKDLTASHASAAVALTVSDASISCGTTLVMTSNAIRSSCSVTSPGSMASQRFLACSLIVLIRSGQFAGRRQFPSQLADRNRRCHCSHLIPTASCLPRI
jgi:hypothetical protein